MLIVCLFVLRKTSEILKYTPRQKFSILAFLKQMEAEMSGKTNPNGSKF